jgi:hypothetical protein
MKNLASEGSSPELEGVQEALSPSEIQGALSAILQSSPFRSSPQIQKVLKFLVLETLAGRGESLKERNIGASLFDRRPDYDTNADPIVRLRVAEVRKRLALYYQGARDETVLISIPSGSFKAVFERSNKTPVPMSLEPIRQPDPIQTQTGRQTLTGSSAEVATSATHAKPSTAKFKLGKWWILVAASAAILAFVALRSIPSADERAFDKFWSPVLENSNTVLVGMGNNPLYELSNAGEDEYYKNHPKNRFQEMGLHPYIPLTPGTPIDGKYINPATDIYLTIGDAVALSNIEYVLAQRHIKLDVRFVNDVTYGDIRQSPTVLIGAHNNIWTLTMTENLRFGFQGHSTIVDRFNPQKQWVANFDRSETYGIVARLLNSWNGKVVIVIGGVGYSGTRAAGDFITNPELVSKMLKSLPKGWESKNIEVVLHTSVKNQIPSPADVVAAYSW